MADDWLNWEDLDLEVDAFTKLDMLIPYKGGWSAQFGRNLARNTSWNRRNATRNRALVNETFNDDQEKDFDTDIDYRNSYFFYWIQWHSNSEGVFTFPLYWSLAADPYPVQIQLTTSYQWLYSGDGSPQGVFEIKALATGGFRLKGTDVIGGNQPFYLMLNLWELQVITGA